MKNIPRIINRDPPIYENESLINNIRNDPRPNVEPKTIVRYKILLAIVVDISIAII